MIGRPLMGVVIGDMAGSPYEVAPPTDLHFPLLTPQSQPTDDTILTLMVAEAVVDGHGDPEKTRLGVQRKLVEAVETWPHGGYGAKFLRWALCSDLAPYGSWANGAAMRVASVAWQYETLDDVETYARITAEVTHNHPEAVRGAETVAGLIWLANHGHTKDDLCYYAEKTKGYDLSTEATDWVVLTNPGDVLKILSTRKTRSALYSVPRSIRAFLETDSFEAAVRVAVCLGGDTDTQGSMTGGIAEAFYGGVPKDLAAQALALCPEDIRMKIVGFLKVKRQPLVEPSNPKRKRAHLA